MLFLQLCIPRIYTSKGLQLMTAGTAPGAALPLLRIAASLFQHVSKLLRTVDLLSTVGQEYGALLRSQLLPIPQYCARAAAATFEGGMC